MKLQKIRRRKQDFTTELKWFDILILTVILFSNAIYTSTIQYISSSNAESFEGATDFSTAQNYSGFRMQLALLLLALLYLWIRNFDFSKWKLRITPKSILYSVLLFLFIALLMDIFFLVTAFMQGGFAYARSFITPTDLPKIDFSLVLYSLLNGIYEEIYFLGMCLSVNSKKMKGAFLFSLLVRFSFHTYQSMLPAIGISLILGTVYYLLYEKSNRKNLFPFFLSHSIADMIGSGILGYLVSFMK